MKKIYNIKLEFNTNENYIDKQMCKALEKVIQYQLEEIITMSGLKIKAEAIKHSENIRVVDKLIHSNNKT